MLRCPLFCGSERRCPSSSWLRFWLAAMAATVADLSCVGTGASVAEVTDRAQSGGREVHAGRRLSLTVVGPAAATPVDVASFLKALLWLSSLSTCSGRNPRSALDRATATRCVGSSWRRRLGAASLRFGGPCWWRGPDERRSSVCHHGIAVDFHHPTEACTVFTSSLLRQSGLLF